MDALFQQRIVIGSLGDGGQGGGVGGLMASSINPANFDPRQHSEGLGIQSLGGSGVSGYRDPRSSPPPPEPFSAPRSHTEPVFPESEGTITYMCMLLQQYKLESLNQCFL